MEPDTYTELECGHARLLYNNLRSDPTGWLTWCYECDCSRRVVSARLRQPVAQGDPKPRGGVASGPSNAARLSADAEGAVAQGDPKPGDVIREALEVNLALWRDDKEPGDFDRDVIEPTQAALAALDELEGGLRHAVHGNGGGLMVTCEDYEAYVAQASWKARAEAAEAKVERLEYDFQAVAHIAREDKELRAQLAQAKRALRKEAMNEVMIKLAELSRQVAILRRTTSAALARAEAAEAQLAQAREALREVRDAYGMNASDVLDLVQTLAARTLEQGDKP